MMYIGCMGCLWQMGLGPVIPSFTFGLGILAIVQMFAHITPVHINPAVSLATLIMGKMHWKQFLVYVVAQYTGAIAGMFLLKIMLPDAPSVCVLRVNMNITEVQAFFIEFTATFVLFLTVAGAVDVQNENKHDSTPARIGLMIAGLVFAAEPFTGAGLNPARALSPAVLYNIWTSHWLYHFAPYAGMATAGILYRFVLDSNEKNSLYSFVNK